jgi:capsular exopolysaccharide synthesis family protein
VFLARKATQNQEWKTMSQLFEGFSRATIRQKQQDTVPVDMVPAELGRSEPSATAEVLGNPMPEGAGLRGTVEIKKVVDGDKTRSVMVQPPATSRLVAWNDPNSLGAEKFRALAVRLDDIRRQHELTSLQVTSSVINEGKSFVAANLAVTLAKYSGSKTLLIEGDLHRPTLASMFGLKDLQGLGDWWTGRNQELARYMLRLTGTGLWFLSAGKACDRPSEILRSEQLTEAFAQLEGQFDWIVVDSTPMLPVIDANLWSRLVDGTLLVVREGIAPLKALKKGLQSLDHPKLIGVVVNEASDFDQIDYDGQYYGTRKYGDKAREKRGS